MTKYADRRLARSSDLANGITVPSVPENTVPNPMPEMTVPNIMTSTSPHWTPASVIMTPGKDEMFAWGGQHQPAVTLVDKRGRVRYRGLLPDEAEERARELLRE